METSFDEWNEQLRELLKQQQEKLASNFQGRKLQEYRDSVSELQVGAAFKFQISTFKFEDAEIELERSTMTQ